MEVMQIGIDPQAKATPYMLEKIETANEQLKTIFLEIAAKRGVDLETTRLKNFTAEELEPVAKLLSEVNGVEIGVYELLGLLNYESREDRLERLKDAHNDFMKVAQEADKMERVRFQPDKPQTIREQKQKKQSYRNFSRKHKF